MFPETYFSVARFGFGRRATPAVLPAEQIASSRMDPLQDHLDKRLDHTKRSAKIAVEISHQP
jgi:hypothetical protein